MILLLLPLARLPAQLSRLLGACSALYGRQSRCRDDTEVLLYGYTHHRAGDELLGNALTNRRLTYWYLATSSWVKGPRTPPDTPMTSCRPNFEHRWKAQRQQHLPRTCRPLRPINLDAIGLPSLKVSLCSPYPEPKLRVEREGVNIGPLCKRLVQHEA